MSNRPILLFSGGVDSTACLQLMKKQSPILFYFETTKMIDKSQKIRKLAKLISPESPFYTFKTETRGYEAVFSEYKQTKKQYYIKMNDKEFFYPAMYNKQVSLGYFSKTPTKCMIDKYTKKVPLNHIVNPTISSIGYIGNGILIPNGQKYLIKKLEPFNETYNFPLKDLNIFEIDNTLQELPTEAQKLVFSSTRPYFKNFIPT